MVDEEKKYKNAEYTQKQSSYLVDYHPIARTVIKLSLISVINEKKVCIAKIVYWW